MKIDNNAYVEVAYKLTVDGKVVDQADETRPLPFIFGQGMLIPKFEENLKGKEVGDEVTFTLTPAEGYGERNEEYINAYPKDMFLDENGKFDESVVFEGAMLQLTTPDGHPLMASVSKIGDEEVTLDFNPPMAGKTLTFDVKVINVREAKPEDMAQFMGGGCGCGCEGGSCDDGSCGCDGGGCAS